jgi:hypothetical protein
MEPFATTAVAVEWEFRCHSQGIPGKPWAWRCKSKDDALVAQSSGRFLSLQDALADAQLHGFGDDLREAPRAATHGRQPGVAGARAA